MEGMGRLQGLILDMNEREVNDHIVIERELDGTTSTGIDDEWLGAWRVAAIRTLQNIERAIDEQYIKLPVDADGVPIRVGDEMESGNETFVICAVAPGRVYRWHIYNIGELDKGTVAYPPESLHHFKPRTVEDVLRDFQQDTLTSQGEYSGEVIDADEWKRQLERDVREYADELRELMGVE